MKPQSLTNKLFLCLFCYLKGSESASILLRGKITPTDTITTSMTRDLLLVRNCTFCHTNAVCLNTDSPGLFECICNDGYDLDVSDNQTCIDRDECLKDKPCSEIGGFCVDHDPENGFYSCGCLDGFRPTAYDEVMGHPTECIDQNECLQGNHTCDPVVGVCKNTAGSFECSCPEAYDMNNTTNICTLRDTKTLPTEDPCAVKNCDSNRSYCVLEADNATAVCLCNDGYFQIGRGAACHDIQECDANGGQGQCHELARCDNLNGASQCICTTGYIGNGVDCEDANECEIGNHDCGAELMCVNEEGGYTCIEYPSSAPSLVPSVSPSSSPTVKKRWAWVKLGQTLQGASMTGNLDDDVDFGRDVSINGAGNMIAVGVKDAIDDSCGGAENGAVLVYVFNGVDEWVQLGNTIYSPGVCSTGLEFGYRVELASDGLSVSIATDHSDDDDGFVAVFELNAGVWEIKGAVVSMISGGSSILVDVYDMAFSGDGTTIAVSYVDVEVVCGFSTWVDVYKYDDNCGSWYLISLIDCAYGGGMFYGESISLSYDGATLAIGDPYAGGWVYLASYDDMYDVYQIFAEVPGSCDSCFFGGSVSLSDTGSLLAIGDPCMGRVEVFRVFPGQLIPDSIGQELNGGANFGAEVDLDADGNTLAVGSFYSGDPGYVTVYINANGVWTQLGSRFGTASNAGFDFGRTVSLSDDGRTLATGANDAPTSNGNTDGIASVHRYVQISG